MIHFTCADCGEPQSCLEIIQLFRGKVAVKHTTGEYWCPICHLLHEGATGEVAELLDGLLCKSCAGTAGYTSLQDALDAHSANIATSYPGLVFVYIDQEGNFLQQVIPGAAPPRTGGIKLEPGELRCSCNNCERLRFA
jgi:hypothetical protein